MRQIWLSTEIQKHLPAGALPMLIQMQVSLYIWRLGVYQGYFRSGCQMDLFARCESDLIARAFLIEGSVPDLIFRCHPRNIARDPPEVYQGPTRDSPGAYQGSARGLPGVCHRLTRGLPGAHLGSNRGLPGVHLGSTRS